jgi:hypothetical protein
MFSKFEAWNDILLTVNYSEAKCLIKGKLYIIKRGESILSLDNWAKRWGWDKSKVRRFMDLLKNDGMIYLKTDNITTHLTVCKYEDYQDSSNASETRTKHKRNTNDFQTTPIKEEEESKEEEKDKEDNILFEKFWDMYPVKVARKDCLKKFIGLPKKTQDLIFETLPSFIAYKPFETYTHPNPLTYLNKERWNDVIVSHKINNTQPNKHEGFQERILANLEKQYGH